MVCLRNVSVDTLHKRDTEDDNNNNNNNNNNLSSSYTSQYTLGNPKVHYPTPYRLSGIVSSAYLPLHPISAGRLHPQPEDAPWPSDKDPLNMRGYAKQG
jgi:hypothetical protein